jgi:hypothetical protein
MNRIKEYFENNKIIQSIEKFANSNIVAKTIAISVFWAIGLVPVWIYLLIRWFIDPIGFWQELAVFLVCAITMGWIQFILAFIVIILTAKIITEDF